MINKPVVFISSTSDLRSARELVGKVLYSMGYEPVWQEIEATDGGELLGVLRKRLDPCSLVIQLVGQHYGAEPPAPTEEFGRVSYTQYEAAYAEKLGIKVIYHFMDPAFPTDATAPDSDERRDLQIRYRQRIKDANKLRQSNIADHKDLKISIYEIADELAALRKQSDERFHYVTDELATIQKKSDEHSHQVTSELTAIRELLNAAITPKSLTEDQNKEPLSPELIEKARILLQRGDAEDQALAKIALGKHAEADRIIQDLKNRPDNPIDDAFRLLTLEGDNWYRDRKFDRAVEPYEQAMSLRPTDIKARSNATLAHTFARLGNLANHRSRAIEIAQATLGLVIPGSADWAGTQNNLGLAWSALPTGDPGENLHKAIAAYQAALTVRTRDAAPKEWAMTKNNLGIAWGDLQTGDRGENLRKAITAYEAALTVCTRDQNPAEWAKMHNNLGTAWSHIPTGDTGDNLSKAITAYESALTVYTRQAYPAYWAATQNNLGRAWSELPIGNLGDNLNRAIQAYEAALQVYTRDADPLNWAWVENSIAFALAKAPPDQRSISIPRAIEAAQAALSVLSKDKTPQQWAMTQDTLGVALSKSLDTDAAEHLQASIIAFENALTVFTRSTNPSSWAEEKVNLASSAARLADLPGQDRHRLLARAISAVKAALLVYAPDTYPHEYAQTKNDLETYRQAYEQCGAAAAQPFDAIAPSE